MKSEESPNFMKFGKVTKKLQNKIYEGDGRYFGYYQLGLFAQRLDNVVGKIALN